MTQPDRRAEHLAGVKIHVGGIGLGLKREELQHAPAAQTPEVERELTGAPIRQPVGITYGKYDAMIVDDLTVLPRSERCCSRMDDFRPVGQSEDGRTTFTRRPSSHTKRAVGLGLESESQTVLPRHLGGHKGEIHRKLASGERVFVKPSTSRPVAEHRDDIDLDEVVFPGMEMESGEELTDGVFGELVHDEEEMDPYFREQSERAEGAQLDQAVREITLGVPVPKSRARTPRLVSLEELAERQLAQEEALDEEVDAGYGVTLADQDFRQPLE